MTSGLAALDFCVGSWIKESLQRKVCRWGSKTGKEVGREAVPNRSGTAHGSTVTVVEDWVCCWKGGLIQQIRRL